MFHQVLIELKAHVTEFQILEIPAILVRHKSNHEFIGYGLGHDFGPDRAFHYLVQNRF